jgi:hypothetical protein
MYFPKDMDATVLAEYEAAMKAVTENPDFIAEMRLCITTHLALTRLALRLLRSSSTISARCVRILSMRHLHLMI